MKRQQTYIKGCKPFSITFILLILSLVLTNCGQTGEKVTAVSPEAEKIVALIGDQTISQAAYGRKFQDLVGGVVNLDGISTEDFEVLINECFDMIVLDYLLDREARERNVDVDDEELLQSIMNYCKHFQGLDFERYLAKQELSYEEFKKVHKQEMIRTKTVREIERAAPEPSAEEIKEYYKDHKSEFDLPTFVAFTQFEFADKVDAEEAYDKFKRDEMFDLLEEDSDIKLKMGRWIGHVRLDSLPPTFVKALEKLEPGEISEIVTMEPETPRYFFFILQEKNDARKWKYEEVKDIINSRLKEKNIRQYFEQWQENMLAKTVIRYFPENINRELLSTTIQSQYSERSPEYYDESVEEDSAETPAAENNPE